MLAADRDQSLFYDPETTASHGYLLNLVMSNRGGGKTFGWTRRCINRYIKRKRQFIYLRRTDEDVKACKDDYLNDMNASGFWPGRTFEVVGKRIMMHTESSDKTEHIGYILALSTASKVRSVAYPYVDTIIFDEFLIENKGGQYLQFEVKRLISFMETVFRDRENVVCTCLANYISKSNPYFDYFKLYPKGEFTKSKEYPVLIHNYKNKKFVEHKSKTQMAALARANEQYGAYMLDNVAMDSQVFLEKRTGNAHYWYTIKFSGETYGVWFDEAKGLVYCTTDHDPLCKNIYAFDTDDHGPNLIMIQASKSHPQIKRLRLAIDNGLCRYDHVTTRDTMWDLLGYL